MGATNRRDILDPALVRPGRFDRIVHVPLPDYNGRIEILNVRTEDWIGMGVALAIALACSARVLDAQSSSAVCGPRFPLPATNLLGPTAECCFPLPPAGAPS